MRYKVYHYSGCGTCRKAIQFLKINRVPFDLVPIRDTPPTPAELKLALENTSNVARLFNTSGADYRAMNLKERLPSLSNDQIFDLLSRNGNLVKRPFVVGPGAAWTGFNEAEWRRRLALDPKE